jgi:ribosomal protein L37AE/L43A
MASAHMPTPLEESRQALRCPACQLKQFTWVLGGRWRCGAEGCGSQNDEGPPIDPELPIVRHTERRRTARRWAVLGHPDRRVNPGRRNYDKSEAA